MKKNLLFLPLFAALTFAGCSKDDPSEVGGSISDGEPRYLAVTIATTPSLGETTRAAAERDDVNGSYTQSTGTYEDGLDEENKVNKVRFYFFSQTGDAVSIKSDGRNYYDYTPESLGSDHSQTVSQKLAAVLIINTKEGDKLPSQMLAVINPTSDMDEEKSLLDLMKLTGDYTKRENGFMMTNSTYLTNADKQVDVTAINSSYYCTSEAEAKDNPIRIYVERCVAKVRVTLGADLRPNSAPVVDKAGEHNLVALTYVDDDKKEQPLTIGEKEDAQQVYVELLGWNINGYRDNGYLVKHLAPAWTNDNGPAGMDASWNLPQLHRSFWADYCTPKGNSYYSYNAMIGTKPKVSFSFENKPDEGKTNYTYCNENAQRETGTLASSVVVPARLCNKDGVSLTICEYAGVRFVDDDKFTTMRNQILFRLQNSEDHFWTKEGDTWRELGVEDIEFTPAYTSADPGQAGRCYVKVQMTSAAKALQWYKSEPGGDAKQEAWTENDRDAVFNGFNHIKIWKDGMTYYYLYIPHTGAANTDTAYGVVRNHVYAITLDKVYGLGTPVFDPAQKIIPEKVDPDNVFVSAQVELLSWRLVNTNVTLDWGK